MNVRFFRILPVLGLAFSFAVSLQATEDIPPSPPLIPAHKVPLTEPAVNLTKDGKPGKYFLARHAINLKRGQEGPIGVLFIGDSITEGWRKKPALDIWNKYYGHLDPANFGIGGAGTQSVLWRIQQGELDGISPKVVVLLIGTNNGFRAGLADGIKKIVERIHEKVPQAKVLLLGIFPRMNKDGTIPVSLRAHVVEVNKEIATLDDGVRVRYLDIGPKFLDAEGNISKEIMHDGLHLGLRGYQIWADAMQPLLEDMLKPSSQ